LAFPLLDEILARSIPYEGTQQCPVDKLINATKSVLVALGHDDSSLLRQPKPAVGVSMEKTPGILQVHKVP
jgi:hypothetical protein